MTWFPLVCAAVLWGVLVCLLWDAVCWIRQTKLNLQRQFAVPCHRCRYANPDYRYLKCTVNPQGAFSEAALGCGDFRAEEETFASRNALH